MNIQELEIIKSLDLPIKFFVLNNQGYGSIRNTQRNYFDGFYVGSSIDSGVSLPDVKAVGKAYGYKVFSITHNDEIDAVVKDVLAAAGSVICEVLIDPNDMLSFRASSRIRPDGSAVSMPPEDLYPFLPRKEFYGNMYIKPLNETGINIRHVLFDMDGTLIDSGPGIVSSMSFAFKNYDYDIDTNKITDAIGLPLMPMIQKLLSDANNETVNGIAKDFRAHYAEAGLYDSELYDGVDEMLKTLSGEYDLFIVTSKPKSFAESIAERTGIGKYFLSITGPDMDFAAKKKSELISELMNDRGLTSENCVMVGDRAEDVNAAIANNIKTVGVTYGYGSAEELKDAILTVDSAIDLVKTLY